MNTLIAKPQGTVAHNSIFEQAVRQLPLPVCSVFGSATAPIAIQFANSAQTLETKDSAQVTQSFPNTVKASGNVVLEALASGLAVVAYDEAAAAQHIRHGHSGALAMPGDQAAFIDAACWLMEEQETLRTVRLNARQHASRQGWPAIVEQFEGFLRDACRAGAPVSEQAPAHAVAIKPGSSAPRG